MPVKTILPVNHFTGKKIYNPSSSIDMETELASLYYSYGFSLDGKTASKSVQT